MFTLTDMTDYVLTTYKDAKLEQQEQRALQQRNYASCCDVLQRQGFPTRTYDYSRTQPVIDVLVDQEEIPRSVNSLYDSRTLTNPSLVGVESLSGRRNLGYSDLYTVDEILQLATENFQEDFGCATIVGTYRNLDMVLRVGQPKQLKPTFKEFMQGLGEKKRRANDALTAFLN